MVSVFLQNLAVILGSLLILANHRADYTLYIAVAAIIGPASVWLFQVVIQAIKSPSVLFSHSSLPC